jgi:hypothetical protein
MPRTARVPLLRMMAALLSCCTIPPTIAQDVSGGDGRMLPMNPIAAQGANKHDAMLAYLVRVRTSKPHTVIMSTRHPCRCLWEVDTRTGKGNIARHGNDVTAAWVVDRDGRAVAREDWDWYHHAYRLLADGTAVVVLAANGRAH